MSRPQQSEWAIVAGDFFPSGGMDIANFSLALNWAQTEKLHLVSHRVHDALLHHPNISTTIIPRPLNSHFLGEFKLRSEASKIEQTKQKRIISNGGNVDRADVVWIHIVHGAYHLHPYGSIVRRLKDRIHHRLAIRNEKRVLQTAKLVVCNSKKSAKEIQDLYQVPRDRIRVVYLGADVDRFSVVSELQRVQARQELQLEDRKWCVFVGQLGSHLKGFDTLYEAWRRIPTSGIDAGLLVAGSGASLDYWKQRAKHDGLNQHIKFLGYRTDMDRVIAASNLFIHPSRYDAYGLAVHEAICRGIPAFVSSATGISELFDSDLTDCILQAPSSSDELWSRLQKWANSTTASYDKRFEALSQKLRSRTWEWMAREFIGELAERFGE